MPLRDYRCDACGHLQEALIRRAEDEADLRCEACGHDQLSRQLSAPASFSSSCDAGFG